MRASEGSLCRGILANAAGIALGVLGPQVVGATESDGPAPAESATPAESEGAVQEVVVTARKRSERLFDVPVAITALTSQDVDRYGASDMSKITEMTPSVNVGKTAGASGAGITIRGIGTDGSNVGLDQSVAVNIDGVVVSRGRAAWLSYFDLAQVEVLKGPQALFFGKNSPAGVISLTSRAPTDHTEAYLHFGYERRAAEMLAEGAISGPIADGFKFRLSGRYRDMKGYMRNVAQPVASPSSLDPPIQPGASISRPGEREGDVRLGVDFDNGGPFTASLRVGDTHYDDDGPVSFMELVHCSSGVVNMAGQGYPNLIDPTGDCQPNWRISTGDPPHQVARTFQNGRDGVPYTNLNNNIGSLTLNYKLGPLTLTSVTGHYRIDTAYLGNFDWSTYALIVASERERYNQNSEELRLLSNFDFPVNFMVGGYYQDNTQHFAASVRLGYLPPQDGRYQWLDRLGITDGKTDSAFAQVTWDITEQLKLAGGARWTRETKRSTIGNTWVNSLVQSVFPQELLHDDFSDTNVSPEATLTWLASRNFMVYGAYKTGYKSGGIGLGSFVLAGTTVPSLTFRPEKSTGGEIGSRWRYANGRGQLSATIYRYTFSDLQVNAWNPVLNTYVISNAAQALQRGAELESTFEATPRLSLRGSVNYNHSRYETFNTASCYSGQPLGTGPGDCVGGLYQDLSGKPTFYAPDWTTTLGATYTQPLPANLQVQVAADAIYSSDYFFVVTESPYARQGGYTKFNASVRLMTQDKNWELALIGRNLTNKIYATSGQDRPGGIGDQDAVLARPRELWLDFTKSF